MLPCTHIINSVMGKYSIFMKSFLKKKSATLLTHYDIDTQSVTYGPVAQASLESLLEIENFAPPSPP